MADGNGENQSLARGLAEAEARAVRKVGWLRVLMPLSVVMALVGAAGLVWVADEERAKSAALLGRKREAQELATAAADRVEAEIGRLRKLAAGLGGRDKWDSPRFVQAVDQLIKPSPAILAVAWVPKRENGNFNAVEFAWAAGKGKEESLSKGVDLFLSKHEPWGGFLKRVEAEKAPRLVTVDRRGPRVEAWMLIPALTAEGNPVYLGSVAARVDVGSVLKDLEGASPPERDVRVENQGVVLYGRGRAIADGDPNVEREVVKLLNRYAVLSLRRELKDVGGGAAVWAVWAGIPLALAVGYGVFVALTRRARAAGEAQWQFAAMEELTRAAAGVSTDLAAGRGALDQLAGSARRLLGMKMACISLVDVERGTIELVARDGLERDRRVLFASDEGKGTLAVFESGTTIVVEDTRTDPRVNPKVLADLYGVVSVIMVPLVVGGTPIGVLYLGNDAPRTYTETEVRLANVLGAQAGVFLAILRLVREKEAALAVQEKLSSQRESLYQIAGEIYRSEDLGESLQRLADEAPAVIGVDICMVSLRTGRGAESHVYAVTGNEGGIKGERHDLAGTHAEEAWTRRAPVIIEDGPADPKLHPSFRHRLHVGSIIYLPLLRTDGSRAMGTMALIRHEPGTFSREQLELATVLAARAATAIEKAKLYVSARRLAHSQETLLRELNHRVKNNLASIVTLLQVNRPQMPEPALRWLNRVTGRVATMARSHELFIGGAASVAIGDLVSKLLPSLSVVKPARAQVRTHLENPDTRLPTDRAVSLAMVLNELCWNALEHGVGEEGLLEIRARRSTEGRLVVEVEDDGGRRRELGAAGGAAGAAAAEGAHAPGTDLIAERRMRGMGLRLVEGLVSRELGGKFLLLESAGGGTLARVDLPILDEGGDKEDSGVAEGVAGRLS